MLKIMNVSEQVFNHVRYLNVLQLRGKVLQLPGEVPHSEFDQITIQICNPLENQVNDKIYVQVVQNTKVC